ncbi:MAG: xylulose kinase [bacterium]|nr:xylulose kinase [bacterium]
MGEKHLIGVDIGTQGTKAVLFSQSGNCLANHFKASKLLRPQPGAVEEDPEYQLESVCDTVQTCLSESAIDPKSVAAVAFCGQMAGIIGVNQDGRHVTPYDSWLDTRCAPYIEKMKQNAGDEILTKTGCFPSFNHGPKILWWKSEHNHIFRQIKAFVQPAGYAVMRLCGLGGSDAFIDKSYLHFSGFADNLKSTWDAELCRQFDVEIEKMPQIVNSHSIVGEITGTMALKCGLPPGTPVAAGCGDTVASFLACGATRTGICVDVAGTASVFAATTAGFQPDLSDKTLGCGRSAVPGLWHPYAYINGGGMNLEWFRKEIAGRGAADGKNMLSFKELDALAEALTPDTADPVFIPHLGGRVSPSQPLLRGAWIGLEWNHTLGHLYRAALEGVAMEYGIYLQILKNLYEDLKISEIRITGGGEKSRIWNQIKADVLGISVVQIEASEGAPMGLALLAGYAAGIFKDLDNAAQQWTKTGHKTAPDPQKNKLFRERLNRYQAYIQAINEVNT